MFCSGLNCGFFVRIAVCAVLLANALFGRTLHLWQHSAEGRPQNETAADQSKCHPSSAHVGHSHRSCGDKNSPYSCSATLADGHDSCPGGSEEPSPPHDHDHCAVCNVIGLNAAVPEVVTLSVTTTEVVDQIVFLDESATTVFVAHCDARGPPIGLVFPYIG